MPTRREVLRGLVSSPLVLSLGIPLTGCHSFEPEVLPEGHCLSQESAAGFKFLLRNRTGVCSNVKILPAVCNLSDQTCSDILRKIITGAWFICESGLCFSSYEESVRQNCALNSIFGVRTHPPVRVSGYITYIWPERKLVRSFQAVTPVRCGSSEMIAHIDGVPVCMKRRMGEGGIVYLGSMLGPGLLAEEREAHVIGGAMLGHLGQRTVSSSDL